MNQKKSLKFVLPFIITCIVLLLLFIFVKHDTPNTLDSSIPSVNTEINVSSESDVTTVPSTQEEDVSETPVPQIEVSVNDESTKDLSSWIDSLIDTSYKTGSYNCDIISQPDKTGKIVSIQLDNSTFSDRENCISAVTAIIEKALSSDFYKEIDSFDFSMSVNSQTCYIILIDNAQDISSTEEIKDHLKIQEF